MAAAQNPLVQLHGLERFAIVFLTLQAAGTCAWWLGIVLSEAFRVWFIPNGIDKSLLGAFLAADLLSLVAAGGAAAYGLARRRAWAWPALCAHAGGAAYASLLAIVLAALAAGTSPGGFLMLPSLIVPPYLVWALRPASASP